VDELFDVVDEMDRVIDRAARAEVHARGLWHRAVHVLVFNGAGQLFLQKRSMLKDQCPGLWGTSAAGHLDSGEDYDAAADREFAEELGCAAPPLERLFKLSPSVDTGWEFVWIYRCRCEGPFDLNRLEIDEGRWFDLRELRQQMELAPAQFTPSTRRVWREYTERYGR